jgi:hypothetical protein
MTLLFAEHGSTVGCFDKSADAVKAILKTASKTDTVPNERVHGFSSLERLVKAFPKAHTDDSGAERKPRIFVLSLPHGDVPDSIADELLPLLDKGDIIIDGGNEWWEATERRQRKAKEFGVEWVGMGVSGGCRFTHRPFYSCEEQCTDNQTKPRAMARPCRLAATIPRYTSTSNPYSKSGQPRPLKGSPASCASVLVALATVSSASALYALMLVAS